MTGTGPRTRSRGGRPGIAVVGMACRYPDASSPRELWENVLAGRRAFRRMPPERLRFEDDLGHAAAGPVDEDDASHGPQVAVLRDYVFDRVRFRIPGVAHRSADIVHWLALDVAAEALADAGFADGDGLPGATTGVVVGNTLTGEMARATTLRHRWPYVRRVVEAALGEEGWDDDRRTAFLARLRSRYEAPFEPPNEESLAGALANTIAGRICNHFDLRGGGYVVDGACAASLVAVATACTGLADGDLDVALVGAVDVSLDPFELVGFARTGALATGDMRVYDQRPTGFLPGEGCGFVALMRADDARRDGKDVRALIEGWGLSSDGHGGITRPEADGLRLALDRAYRRAGRDPSDVAYFEGHGTGTAAGDAAELQALRLLRGDSVDGPPAVIGSVKANIGHTKAAAGMAGLLKAVKAVQTSTLPPMPVDRPHPRLAPALRTIAVAEPWPAGHPPVAGVTAMGFGGINAHVVVSGQDEDDGERRRDRVWWRSAQDAELFLLAGATPSALSDAVRSLEAIAGRLSWAELGDAAAALAARRPHERHRAAIVAGRPGELERALTRVRAGLDAGRSPLDDVDGGVFVGDTAARRSVGFVFPGQGAPVRRAGGALNRRFPCLDDLYPSPWAVGSGAEGGASSASRWTGAADGTDAAGVASGAGGAGVEMQTAVVRDEIAALRLLARCGVRAAVGVGHSLGEYVALHWAGVIDEPALRRVVRRRATAMAACPAGSMVAVACPPDEAVALAGEVPVGLAAWNGPEQTVLSGPTDAVDEVLARCRARGVHAVRLPVPHAFHSPLVAAARVDVHEALTAEVLTNPVRRVVSTVTGREVDSAADVVDLLVRQVVEPVRFVEALRAAAPHADMFVEVGPGRTLGELVAATTGRPVLALDAGGPSVRGFLTAVGGAFAAGQDLDVDALFRDRLVRPIDLGRTPSFIANPCETAPVTPRPGRTGDRGPAADRLAGPIDDGPSEETDDETGHGPGDEAGDAVTLVRRLAAERAELPPETVLESTRLLGDLHLNSIAVSDIAQAAARRLGLRTFDVPLELATATVGELAGSLEELPGGDGVALHGPATPGARPWVRTYEVVLVPCPVPPPAPGRAPGRGRWTLVADAEHPVAAAVLSSLEAQVAEAGLVICLPAHDITGGLPLLVQGGRLAARQRTGHVVVVQSDGVAASFVGSMALEQPGLTYVVIDLPFDEHAAARVTRDVQAATGFHEVVYDHAGVRHEPRWRLLAPPRPPASPSLSVAAAAGPGAAGIGRDDVVLVTGGGKGIGAECALHLGRTTGARLALLGRSSPDCDPKLAANLARFDAAGVDARYLAVDVADAGATGAAVESLQDDLGPVTVVLHAAGINVARPVSDLDVEAIEGTLRPKLDGLRNVVAGVSPERLRHLVAFGSIISRTGLPGEAHYALANEALRREVQSYAARHPSCQCVVAEWSVWAGTGMGERMGRINALLRQGITPIPLDEGVRRLADELSRPSEVVARVVTGRFGRPPTVELEGAPLPLARFLETPLVHYPGVELVTEVDVSVDTDPYLADHVYSGARLLPAVIALEAMAQVAVAVRGALGTRVGGGEVGPSRAMGESRGQPSFEEVTFSSPVLVAPDRPTVVRVCAVVGDDDSVDVVVRSDANGFAVDHVRARCRFGDVPRRAGPPPGSGPGSRRGAERSAADIDAASALYQHLLFHGPTFRRVRGYRQISSTGCVAEVAARAADRWFGAFLPQGLVLGDPAARDAFIHAIQACVPSEVLLPASVGRLVVHHVPESVGTCVVHAREVRRDDDGFLYDVDVTAPDGRLLESWHHLRLGVADRRDPQRPWHPSHLGPLVEQGVRDGARDGRLQVAVVTGEGPRHDRRTALLDRLLGNGAAASHRPDGRPDPQSGLDVSLAYAEPCAVGVIGAGPVACDVEVAVPRTRASWSGLLGSLVPTAEAVAARAGEPFDVAATRLWTVAECCQKLGRGPSPTTIASASADRWVRFSLGDRQVHTLAVGVQGVPAPVVLAVAGSPRDEP